MIASRQWLGHIGCKSMDFQNFQPCLLVAMPELEDPNFEKTVVLLSHFGDDGALGFIINREQGVTLNDSLQLSVGELLPQYQDYPLYFGGPVEPGMIWICYDARSYHDEEAIEFTEDLHCMQDGKILIEGQKPLGANQLRVFHGCAGWSTEQLTQEIADSYWITTDITRELVLDTPVDKIWTKAVADLGFDPTRLHGPGSNLAN